MPVLTESRDSQSPTHVKSSRVVLVGGSGQIGTLLSRYFLRTGCQPVVLTRSTQKPRPGIVPWDGRRLGSWIEALKGADAVINLAGRSVDCRYTKTNRREILESRVTSTQLIGDTIQKLTDPPRVWLNASTATIYRHAPNRPMDERKGEIGGSEPDVPETWR